MIELRPDAPVGSLIFWSSMLVVWIIWKVRQKKTDKQDKE